MISYAQNFEDVMLARVFGRRTDGFYVDVGAGDPVEMSVTKWFYDLGWSGINIEPNPVFHQKLVAERTRDINLKCGAGAFDGEAQYFQLPTNELSSFDPEIRAHAEAAGTPVVCMTAAVLRLTTMLDRHADERPIDFLKIDVEGWEHEVLTGLDLQRYRPTLIVVEATLPETRVETHSKWESLLLEADYSVVHFDGLSRFYLPKERMDLKVHFELPPNVFDDIKTWPHAATEIDRRRLRADLGRAHEGLAEFDRAQAASAVVIGGLRADLERAHTMLAELRDASDRAQAALHEKDRQIASLHGEAEARLDLIKRLHADLERRNADCEEKDREIASVHGEAEARLDLIKRLHADLERRNADCEEKDREIASVHGEAEVRLDLIKRLDADLRIAREQVQKLEK
jgi:FkbM family methyltransferase